MTSPDMKSWEEFFLKFPVGSRVFFALCERPYGMTCDELIQAVYNGSGEPDWARSSVSACIHKLNRRLKQRGSLFSIRGYGGPGSRYQIFLRKP